MHQSLKSKLLIILVLLLSQLSAKTYDSLLRTYVKEGCKEGVQLNLVNYRAWSEDPRHKLAMEELTETDPTRLSKRETLVFWINAYNLLTIDLIIKEKELESIKNLGGWFSSPWKTYHWEIAGKQYTLDEIEHRILRKMGDPRVHMAIVCASVSCPDLRAEAYTVEALESQLNDQCLRFLSNEKKGIQMTQGSLLVSKIFSWFRNDFEAFGGVPKFIIQYRGDLSTDQRISGSLDYNWNLNGIW